MVQNPKTFFEQFQNFIEESGLQLKKFKSNLSNYFTKSEAIDTFLGKTDQAESAKKADEAIKATQDSEGNVISSTYLKTNTASTTYLTQANASSTYLTKTGKATSASTADTAGSATKATQDAKGNVIDSTYLTKSDATSTYLTKDGKVASAANADTATKASQDSSGNEITTTYLKKADAESTYLGKTAKAESAKSADTATKATKDSDGNTINATYVKSVNGSKPVNGDVTVDIPTGVHIGTEAPTDEETSVWIDTSQEADKLVKTVNNQAPDDNGNVNIEIPEVPEIDTSSLIPKTGNRGQLAGYETSYVVDPADDAEGSILFVNESSPDTQRVQGEGNITISVQSGSTGTSWTKTLLISSGYLGTFTRLQLGNGWTWEGEEIPALEQDAEYLLVLHWCNDVGIASLVVGGAVRKAGKGVLSITDDSNAYVWVYQDSADAKSLVYQFFSPGQKEIQLAVGDQLNAPINVTVVNSSGITFDTTSDTFITVTDIEPEFSLTVQSID